jgi:hypothetical protein
VLASHKERSWPFLTFRVNNELRWYRDTPVVLKMDEACFCYHGKTQMTDFFERAEPISNLYTQGNHMEALHLTLAESATGRGMHGVIVAGGKDPRFQMTPGSVNACQPWRALPAGSRT